MAPSDPLHSHPRSSGQPETLDRLDRVLRAAGRESASRNRAGRQVLVAADDAHPRAGGQTRSLIHDAPPSTHRPRGPTRPAWNRAPSRSHQRGIRDRLRARRRAPSRSHAAGAGADFGSRHFPRAGQWHRRLGAAHHRIAGSVGSILVRRGAAEPETTRQSSHGCELGKSGREPGATTCPTRLEHRATSAVAHPETETVLLLSLPIVWLEGPLHAWPPRRGKSPPEARAKKVSNA